MLALMMKLATKTLERGDRKKIKCVEDIYLQQVQLMTRINTLKYRIKGAPFIRGQKNFCPASFLFDVRPLYSNSFIFGVFGAPIIFQIIFLESCIKKKSNFLLCRDQ